MYRSFTSLQEAPVSPELPSTLKILFDSSMKMQMSQLKEEKQSHPQIHALNQILFWRTGTEISVNPMEILVILSWKKNYGIHLCPMFSLCIEWTFKMKIQSLRKITDMKSKNSGAVFILEICITQKINLRQTSIV